MSQTSWINQLSVRLVSLFLMVGTLLAVPLSLWAAEDRQLDSGPFSISVRGGAVNDSAALGVDGRVDYLNQLLNVHLFGTFDWLDAGHGEGQIDNTRYGGGLALSHTFARQANVFAGTSLIREMDKNFAQAYLGGKLKLTDYAILSASYGFGFDNSKEVQRYISSYLAAEAVDWLKVGGVLVGGQGLKANLYYHLTDPGRERISGIEGELSYAVLNNLTVGANGSCDLTEKGDLERNWRTALFVTYAFGSQKASPIDITLDKNNPIEYPQVIRKIVQLPVIEQPETPTPTPTPTPPPAGPLSITQSSGSVGGCTQSGPLGTITFHAIGGVGPYIWTMMGGPASNLTVGADTSTASWYDGANAFCSAEGANLKVAVRDSTGASVTAFFTVNPPN